MMVRSIVCPIDFSEQSLAALAAAGAIALRSGAQLYMLHVLPAGMPGTDAERHEERCRKRLRSMAMMLLPEELSVYPLVSSGDPADEIVRFARDTEGCLIVMATSGRTGWEFIRDGSIADEVASLSERPVLALRAREDDCVKMQPHHREEWLISLN